MCLPELGLACGAVRAYGIDHGAGEVGFILRPLVLACRPLSSCVCSRSLFFVGIWGGGVERERETERKKEKEGEERTSSLVSFLIRTLIL